MQSRVPKPETYIYDLLSIQLNVGIIAACIPTLKPLFRAVLDYTKGVSSSSGHNSHNLGRTPNGNLSYASAKVRRANRTNSIQLSELPYGESDDKTLARVDFDKFPHHASGDGGSDFDPAATSSHSPKTSEETILPNNIHHWPISPMPASTNGIRLTTEVIVQTSTNEGAHDVGRPTAGSFERPGDGLVGRR